MKGLQDEQRRWLVDQLQKHGRGSRGALAAHLGVRNDAITRMTNLDGKKEAREISIQELVGMAEFFAAEPPGLTIARKARQASERGDPKVVRVPLLDTVTAGKLRPSSSQIPVEDVPLLAFADLGRGEFFALRVEGDSMDRISPEGSVIVVNKAERTLVNGRYYVFSHRGETTFKMWQGGDPQHLAPYSTNPANKPIFFKKKSHLEVIGRVKRTILEL